MTIARLQRGVTLADVLVHEAGHAVAAWELGVRIGAIHVHVRVREGRMTFASDVGLGRFPIGSDALRLAIEREMVVLHAGLVAQRRFHYEGAWGLVPRTDYEGILATALQVETDLRLIDEWSDYAEERARALIELPQTWRRVQALAVELARHPVSATIRKRHRMTIGSNDDGLEAGVNIANVIRVRWSGEEFVDDWNEVVERTNGSEPRSVEGARGTAQGGE